jgi:hypothetical protein
MRRMIALGLVFAGSVYFVPACGGDSSSDSGGSGGGGTGGTEAGTGATGGSTGGAAGSGASGGTGGTAACVPADCPGFQGVVAGCCLDDGGGCGYDGTAYGYGCLSQDEVTKLLEGGVPADAGDPNCDSYQVAGQTIVGCCPPSGYCGVYDPYINKKCVDWSELPSWVPKPDTGAPKPCGADAGTGDASDDGATEAGTDASSD